MLTIEPLEPRILASTTHLPTYRLYVSAAGNDTALGVESHPLRTLAKAERIAATMARWCAVEIVIGK